MRAKIALLLAGALLMGLPASAPAAPIDRNSAPVAQRGDDAEALAGGGPYWSEIRRRCFKPIHQKHAVRIHCFNFSKLRKDGNGRRDFYALHHYGSARSKDGYGLKAFGVRVFPHEESARIMNWSEMSPASDKDGGNCNSVTVGLSKVAVLTYTHSWCEKWDVTPDYNRPGKFKNVWRMGSERVEQSEREVAYVFSISVREGKKPRWHFRSFVDTYQ